MKPKNLFEYTDVTQSQKLKTQVCIIGSGCGGATIAKKLTDRGLDVIILEQGGYYPATSMDQNELNMSGKLSAERNFSTNHDSGTVLLSGNNVGGASVHYWADSYRTPDWKLKRWAEKYGIEGHTKEDLAAAWDELEKNLNIHPATDEYMNKMNLLLKDASKKLDWHGHRVPQARKYCQKSGHCMQGCLYDAKQSQMVTHIPQALAQGGRLYADAQAETLTWENGKASSLKVNMINRATNKPNGITLTIEAEKFVVAAGGFNSSFFLLKQGLKKQLPALGKYFSMNPSTMVHALYDENITLWRNIPASYGIDEFLQHRPSNGKYIEGGYMLMANQVQPALLAASMPGYGSEHSDFMKNMSNIGGTISWIDDIEDELGEIRITDKGNKEVLYEYGPKTQAVLKDSIIKQAQLLFTSGAKKVVIAGHQGITLNSLSELHKVESLVIEAGGLFLASPHPGGGCRMGKDPKNSVVNSDHLVHGFDNLYVSDSSVFPTSSALDPSLTLMAFSYIAAEKIIESFKS